MSKIDEIRSAMVAAMKAGEKEKKKLYPCFWQLLRINRSTNVQI